jgi:CHAT domain-containing protein/tetratricopeptide (TPR) repeat protein
MTHDDEKRLRSAAFAFHDASRKDKAGDKKGAAVIAAKAIDDRRIAVGYVDKPLAEEILSQASRMASLGRDADADRLFDEGIAAFEGLYGQVSRDRSAALSLRAMSRRRADLPRAVVLQREAAEGYRTVLGDDHEAARRSWQVLASMYHELARKQVQDEKWDGAAQTYRLEGEAHRMGGAPAWRSREALALADQWRRFGALNPADRRAVETALDATGKAGGPITSEAAVAALATLDGSLGRGSPASLAMARTVATATAATGGNAERIDAAFADLIARLETERGKDCPLLNESVEQWASLLNQRGAESEAADRPADAARPYERAVNLLATYFGPEHYLTRSARCTLDRARVLDRLSLDDRRAVRESFALMEQTSKLTRAAKPAAALEPARKALEIRRRVLGTPSREVGFCHYAIGKLQEDINHFADAEISYREALAQYTPVLGGQHPDCAEVWTNLGKLNMIATRHDVARTAFGNAIEIWKGALGREHPRYARGLVNLAGVPLAERDAVEAGALLDEAIAILETADAAYRGDLARAYNGLAATYEGTDRFDGAEVLFKKAIKAWKEAGLEMDRAISLDNLAILLNRQGRPADAEPFSAEAVAILDRKLGPGNHDTIQAKASRAHLLSQLGRQGEAAKLLEENLDASFALFEASALGASERDGLMALLLRRTLLDAYLTLALPGKVAPQDVYRRVVQWKAAVFGRQRADRFARRSASLDREVTDARLSVRRLANLCLTVPDAGQVDEWRKSIRDAAASRDSAERALAVAVRRWTDSANGVKKKDWAYAAPDLPAGAVVIDFFQYTRYGLGGQDSTERVIAFVVQPDRAVSIADLGDSDVLARAIDDWRVVKTTRGVATPRGDVVEPVRKGIVAPLASALRHASLVLTCPDGPLVRMPLVALPHPDTGRPLIETTLVVTIPHLSQVPDRSVLSSWLAPRAMGPNGNAKSAEVPSLVTVGSLDYGPPAARGFSFEPLKEDASELSAVQASFASAFGVKAPAPLTARAATETVVKGALPGKSVIHLATHGFVVPDVQLDQLMRVDEHIARQLAIGQGGSPRQWRAASLLGRGVLSGLGLSLANAPLGNEPGGGEDDNRLTAAEVALLDLSASRLAVLSACETGVGESAEAEAVVGLQRAFHIAGTESVIASLWKVDDVATARMMGSFYRWFWTNGAPAVVALHQAQREVLAGTVRGDGPVREPDFTAKTTAKTPALSSPSAEITRLWAAFTISYCRDDSTDKPGKP